MRVLLRIEYDGTAYAGWQRQENAMTVQRAVEIAWEKRTGEKRTIVGASRTDAGVHALCQAAHVDTETRIPAEKLAFALNAYLPGDIRVWESRTVPEGFHVCRDALRKRYEYTIARGAHAPAIGRDYAWHVYAPLDVSVMERALRDILGKHDFRAFAAAGSSAKTTVREIFSVDIREIGRLIVIGVEGNGFLYNMVRIIAGTLADIGRGRLASDVFLRAFAEGDRECLGQTAPARGLCLLRIDYAGIA